MTSQIEVTVIESIEKIRLRNYLKDKIDVLNSSKSIKKAITAGQVLLNGNLGHTGDYVKTGDKITYLIPKNLPPNPSISIKLEVPFEDDFLAVISKPAGVLTSGVGKLSIAKCLSHNLKPSGQSDRLNSPKLIHRLDRDTSGLLIAVKTRQASQILRKALAERLIDKTYQAIVEGKDLKFPQDILFPIDDKPSHTKIVNSRDLNTKNETSLLSLKLLTGRTHQIRKHLSAIGHPIVGDNIYNKSGLTFKKGMFLTANQLTFRHPITKQQINVSINLPKKFLKYV